MKLVLKNISLPLAKFSLAVDIAIQSRVTAIFGPSGSGKTSLLDLIAGLRRADSAFIQLDDHVLTNTEKRWSVPTSQRGIGYVPQDLALFPHLSVRQNLLYGSKGGENANPLFRFNHVVELLEIQSLITRGVTELSGGEKQRVALARALLASPRLLLLDEPLASLDLQLKARIIPYLSRIRDEFQIPMLYVTHDRFETLALADDIIVLTEGKVAQIGTVQAVFNRPADQSIAGVLTIETILAGRILNTANGIVSVLIGITTVCAVDDNLRARNGEAYVCIRAEDVILVKGSAGASSARNHLPAIVKSLAPEGHLVRVELDCGFNLSALLTKQACEEMNLKPGDNVVTLVKAPHIHLISR